MVTVAAPFAVGSRFPTVRPSPVDAAVIKPPRNVECGNRMDCGTPNRIRDLWVVEDQSVPIAIRKHGRRPG